MNPVSPHSRRSSPPKQVHFALPPECSEALKVLLHQRPCEFSKESSHWTLDLLAEVAAEQGLATHKLTPKGSGRCSCEPGSAGRGPRRGSTVPTQRTHEKSFRDGRLRLSATHSEWVVGFQYEAWWSRVSPPHGPSRGARYRPSSRRSRKANARHLLLRNPGPLPGRSGMGGADVGALRGRAPGQCADHRVPRVELPESRSTGASERCC